MGTRWTLIVKNHLSYTVLWAHWDGYPDYVVPLIRECASVASEAVGTQRHWLSYPMDVAGILVFCDALRRMAFGRPETRPDVRPMDSSMCDDDNYVYVLDVEDGEKGRWLLKCYETTLKYCKLSRARRERLWKEMGKGKEPPGEILVHVGDYIIDVAPRDGSELLEAYRAALLWVAATVG